MKKKKEFQAKKKAKKCAEMLNGSYKLTKKDWKWGIKDVMRQEIKVLYQDMMARKLERVRQM